jgi:hypothetical protein
MTHPTTLSLSNSLTDLAARIKAEHQATSNALNESVQHAIKAGELLLADFSGYGVDGAAGHTEWVLQRQFKTPCEWLGEEGASFRKTWGMRQPSAEFISKWNAFREEHRDKTLADIEALIIERRQREEREAAERHNRKEAARERKKLRLQRLAEEMRAQ